jgi:hypothetical protein
MPFTAAMVGSHPGPELQQKDDDDRAMEVWRRAFV